ncbi:hypothetical protein [Streptomyces sp. NPDC048277]|uniref:hypothetical protein n=1 Tax=Streptomyces sp. NPDC048277 TaxID=3155027 RepID=UPI0033D5C82A
MRVAVVSAFSAMALAVGATAAAAAPAQTLTIRPSATTVQLGDVVTFTGRATGVEDGSQVTLQVKDGGGWQSLPGTATLDAGAYRLDEKFDDEGVEVLRVTDGRAVSSSVSVQVRTQTQTPGRR